MKVLIIGGYSMTGYYLAKRFYKESYEITIIDERKPFEFNVKHSGYQLKLTDEKCELIFKNKGFDVVVYLEQQPDELYNIDGFIHMLELSAAYHAKSFIFLSQDEITGSLSPNAAKKKKLMEAYCKENDFDHLIHVAALRTGVIYGMPCEAEKSENLVQQAILNFIGHKQKEDAEAFQVQLIYVEEVVDAIVKAAQYQVDGMIRLLDEEKIESGRLLSMLNELDIENSSKAQQEQLKVNPAAAKVLHWKPKYSQYEALEKTVTAYKQQLISFKKEERYEKISRRQNKWLPFVENFLAFCLVFILSYSTRNELSRYAIFPMDFGMLYVLMISLIYGASQGIIAAVLSCFSYIYIYAHETSSVMTMVYSRHHMMQLLLYITVAVLASYIVDNKKRQIDHLEGQLKLQKDENSMLEKVNEETMVEKNQIYEQVLSSDKNLGVIYQFFKELNSLVVEDVFNGAIHTIEKLMPCSKVSIYAVSSNNDFLRLIGKSRDLQGAANTVDLAKEEKLAEILKQKDIFINRAQYSHLPIMIAPIVENDHETAVIFLDYLPFEKLTLHYENIFKVAVSLIGQSVSHALTYEQAIKEEKYVGSTMLMQREYFQKLLQSKAKAKSFFDMDYVVLEMVEDEAEESVHSVKWYEQKAQQISEYIRETDYIGIGRNDKINIVLSNVDEITCLAAIERLKEHKIDVRLGEKNENTIFMGY